MGVLGLKTDISYGLSRCQRWSDPKDSARSNQNLTQKHSDYIAATLQTSRVAAQIFLGSPHSNIAAATCAQFQLCRMSPYRHETGCGRARRKYKLGTPRLSLDVCGSTLVDATAEDVSGPRHTCTNSERTLYNVFRT